jgi:Family of unknown function (DUF5856)
MSSSRSKKTGVINNQELSLQFLSLLSAIRFYHWHTPSYIGHQETGKLYDALGEAFDEFIECLQGARARETLTSEPKPPQMGALTSMPIMTSKQEMLQYLRQWQSINTSPTSHLTLACREFPSLSSIKDNICNLIHRTCYLLEKTDK